ncbi:hypothetical protein GCM10010982_14960 [Bowmanella pacifica]|uniref:Uncharacterized protein n=1 Tax=Bowmanella pacifica TaxID=502051 RepID=A0A917YVD6_9ALTE|nr:hypothetical protein GCM10010982_14960 [Bowmanella pacifica]
MIMPGKADLLRTIAVYTGFSNSHPAGDGGVGIKQVPAVSGQHFNQTDSVIAFTGIKGRRHQNGFHSCTMAPGNGMAL